MQMQSTYWLEKVLKMIFLYVSAFLCTLQRIVINAMQLSVVNSENWQRWVASKEYIRYDTALNSNVMLFPILCS